MIVCKEFTLNLFSSIILNFCCDDKFFIKFVIKIPFYGGSSLF